MPLAIVTGSGGLVGSESVAYLVETGNCSVLEAIGLCEQIAESALDWEFDDDPRVGDHRWWMSDLNEFRRDYPAWELTHGIEEIPCKIYEPNVETSSVAV